MVDKKFIIIGKFKKVKSLKIPRWKFFQLNFILREIWIFSRTFYKIFSYIFHSDNLVEIWGSFNIKWTLLSSWFFLVWYFNIGLHKSKLWWETINFKNNFSRIQIYQFPSNFIDDCLQFCIAPNKSQSCQKIFFIHDILLIYFYKKYSIIASK
jgi:hypothetical protein